MRARTPVRCQACGHAYAARIVEGDVILETNDGDCACGNDAFTVIRESAEQRAGTTD